MTVIRAIAHTNIALIKYWGKRASDGQRPRDGQRPSEGQGPGRGNLPAVGSLSLTLDKFFTTTEIEPAEKDSFLLEGQRDNSRVLNHISFFRQLTGRNLHFKIVSHNQVPTAAGLASSASGFAALTIGLSKAFGLDFSKKELSRIARAGSGSAARSIFGGFAIMHALEDDAYAEAVSSPLTFQVAMIVVECDKGPKSISSRDAMNRVAKTSVFYQSFLDNHPKLLNQAMNAVQSNELRNLGTCMEQSTLQMHATTLGCEDPFWYFNSTTIAVISKVRTLRDQGMDCFFTMDAGPHVKVLCDAKDAPTLSQLLSSMNGVSRTTTCFAGPEAYLA